MPTPPAPPLSTQEVKRLRALHLADQAEAARRPVSGGAHVHIALRIAADVLLVVFGLTGAYAVGAAEGVVPPSPWSTVDLSP